MQNTLVDGGTIRKLWPGEADKYREHLLRLDPESRRNRFSGAVSDDFIIGFVSLTLSLDTVIHGFFVDGVLRGAGELRVLGGRFSDEAEAAFSIEKPWQSHGVGSELLERTLLAARNRGIKLLHMTCLANNQRMQQLARKFEAELSFDFGSVIGEVETPYPTPLSMLREVVADSHGFATAVLDAQSRLFRRRQAANG
jgi:GNAT superfamily N-acetyltransferase